MHYMVVLFKGRPSARTHQPLGFSRFEISPKESPAEWFTLSAKTGQKKEIYNCEMGIYVFSFLQYHYYLCARCTTKEKRVGV